MSDNKESSKAILWVAEFFFSIKCRKTFFKVTFMRCYVIDHARLVRDGFCPIGLTIKGFRINDF